MDDTYLFQPNDSLTAVAAQYGVSVDSVLKYNNFQSPVIAPNSVVRIPPPEVTKYEPIRNMIKKAEGATYNSTFGNGKFRTTNKPLTEMTFSEFKDVQKELIKNGSPSTVAGAYQFRLENVVHLQKELGLADTDIVTPLVQDKMADHLLEQRGIKAFMATGKVSDFTNNLAQEWAGIPRFDTGKSHYDKDGLNAARIPLPEVTKTLTEFAGGSITGEQGSDTLPVAEKTYVESNYAKDAPEKAGHWTGPNHDEYVPPESATPDKPKEEPTLHLKKVDPIDLPAETYAPVDAPKPKKRSENHQAAEIRKVSDVVPYIHKGTIEDPRSTEGAKMYGGTAGRAAGGRFVPKLETQAKQMKAIQSELKDMYNKYKEHTQNVDAHHFELWKKVTNEGRQFSKLEEAWQKETQRLNDEAYRQGSPRRGL